MIPNPLRLLWAIWAWLLVLPTLIIAAVPILALPRLGHRRALARAACLGRFDFAHRSGSVCSPGASAASIWVTSWEKSIGFA